MSTPQHSADDAAVGFYYQGLFALLVLLDAGDDGSVAVEAGDDVELRGSDPTLFQLKHSLGDPPAVSVKSDGFWKTLAIWAPHAKDMSRRFVFVTCADLQPDSSLQELCTENPNVLRVVKTLVAEAERVVKAREIRQAAGERLPYAVRIAGCEALLSLLPDDLSRLISRIRIASRQVNAADLPNEIEKRLNSYLPPAIRPKVVERLIEWWDRQVALSLLKKRSPHLFKRELQEKLHEIIAQHASEGLPDDFSLREPESLETELGTAMERQINLVNGGHARIHRAAVARWRARNQRERWMKDDLSLAAALDTFDQRLIERWADRHGPMRDDYAAESDDAKRMKGVELLDWSHLNAPNEVPPVRPRWSEAFLVQGSYQQLADELKVGWHPQFRELFQSTNDDEGDEH